MSRAPATDGDLLTSSRIPGATSALTSDICLSWHGGTRPSIPFADDREFETRGNYLVNQWPEVRHDAKFDLCFGMPREQVAHRADGHRFHLAFGNPVASVRELQPEQ